MNRHPQLIKTTAALLLAAGTTAAQATLVAYDPFLSGDDRAAGEYTDNGIAGDIRQQGAAAQGWVGTQGIDGFGVAHAGSTSNFVPNAVGENSAAVDYEQGGRLQWLGVGNFTFDRNLTRQLNPTGDSAEWWMSIQVNRLNWTGLAEFNTHIVGGFTDAGGNGLQVGYDDLNDDFIPELVFRTGGTNTLLLNDAPANDNQLVIVQLLINQAGNDTINIWVDPATVDPLAAADVTISDQNLTDSLAPFTQSKYESPGQSGVAYFDEIRLATTFDDVAGIGDPPLPGDTDGDGDIDDADLGTSFSNFTGPVGAAGGKTAAEGDTDGDGDVDDADLANSFSGFTGPLGPAAVPEPASLALLGLGGLALMRRRRG